MRNLILAIVVTVLGFMIVFGRLIGDTDTGSGAYAAGQNGAFILGFIMLGAGVWAIVKHFDARA